MSQKLTGLLAFQKTQKQISTLYKLGGVMEYVVDTSVRSVQSSSVEYTGSCTMFTLAVHSYSINNLGIVDPLQ